MSATRPRLLVPGLLPRDPARETYRVRGGGATTLELRADDRLTVRDLDGGQRAELTVARDDYGALELAGRELLFGPSSPAGAEETFRALRTASVTVTVPAGGLVVEGGIPASDLQLEVSRARPLEQLEPTLPEPLAEPRLDFEVQRA